MNQAQANRSYSQINANSRTETFNTKIQPRKQQQLWNYVQVGHIYYTFKCQNYQNYELT